MYSFLLQIYTIRPMTDGANYHDKWARPMTFGANTHDEWAGMENMLAETCKIGILGNGIF